MKAILLRNTQQRQNFLLICAASCNFKFIIKQFLSVANPLLRAPPKKQEAVGAYIWAWLYYAYVKFVMFMRDMWVVQWYCIFEGLDEMCEVVGVELYLEVDW